MKKRRSSHSLCKQHLIVSREYSLIFNIALIGCEKLTHLQHLSRMIKYHFILISFVIEEFKAITPMDQMMM